MFLAKGFNDGLVSCLYRQTSPLFPSPIPPSMDRRLQSSQNSLVHYFKTECGGLRLTALTILPAEAVRVTEVVGVGSWQKTVGKSEHATVDSLKEQASFNLLKPSGNFTYHQV
jgi:hypothetical protein